MELRETDAALGVDLAKVPPAPLAPGQQMDRIYRYQRHFYDLTRPAFLFGRDALLRRMRLGNGDRVLEVGCGTARNLVKLQALQPSAKLYGLDASAEMLVTAKANLERVNLERRVELVRGLAEEICPRRTFGLSESFDAIFFSYSLSMIPESLAAVEAAVRSLKAGSSLYIVDFGDQAGLPASCRAALTRWFRLFGVEYRPALYAHLGAMAASGAGRFERETRWGGYALFAEFQKAAR